MSSDVNVGFIDKSTFPTYQNRYGAGYGPYYSKMIVINEYLLPDGT